jgi:type IV pilus assembly protein PilE
VNRRRTAISSSHRAASGFSLIELMIVVVIVAVLASLANATYARYITKANRAAAAAYMHGVANRQEQYFLDARQYAEDMTELGATPPAEVSEHYTIATTAENDDTPPSFEVTATPISGSAQAERDAKCGTLTLTNAGAKSISGTGTVQDCWQ